MSRANDISAKTASLGVPPLIDINDNIRQRDCDAHQAEFVSVEGEFAIYRGICANRHKYDIKIELKKIQRQQKVEQTEQQHIVNGEIKIGGDNGFTATELQEY